MTGQPAPDFSATASDGKVYRLKELSGKPLVLVFYCRNNTPG